MSRIFIGGLLEDASRSELEREFEYFGRLKDVWVARNPPGFGFIIFEDHRDAADAVEEMDGRRVCGSRIRVEFARGPTRGGRGARFGHSSSRGNRYGRRSRSRSRSYERGRYDRERSYERDRRRRRSRSRSRSRDRSRRSRSHSGHRRRSPPQERRSHSRQPSNERRSPSPLKNKERSRSLSHVKEDSPSRSQNTEENGEQHRLVGEDY